MIARHLIAALLAAAPAAQAQELWPPRPDPGSVRVATFNASLSRQGPGLAWKTIAEGGEQPQAIAQIIRAVRPDVLLIQELDHDPEGLALQALADLLRRPGPEGTPGVDYPHTWSAPPNTGVPTGLDLDGDGRAAGPPDAQGWGQFPGQYGMALLSRLPIAVEDVRTFRTLLWRDMPGALLPSDAYPPEALGVLRMSSKSHWDVPVLMPDGRRLHVLASHPTPPVFDGPEDRNGRRNHDEIRFWLDYVSGRGWMTDDEGRSGALTEDEPFVILGDLNADPVDGDARRDALLALLAHPRVKDPRPASPGAALASAAQGAANARHTGLPDLDTADWRDEGGPGNLRVDYVLPSEGWTVTGAGVFWPAPDHPLAPLVAGGGSLASSDHRLVWADLR